MGPKAPKVMLVAPARNFKWEPFYMDMAHYLRDHYSSYKKAQAANQKIGFLREMRDWLKVTCTDIQVKNGFSTFLKKYTDVRQKLNSSGFGVDPEKDKSLEMGWILKQCPYFEILDSILGTRPNVTPPCIVSTSIILEPISSSPVSAPGQGSNAGQAPETTTDDSELDITKNNDMNVVEDASEELLDIEETTGTSESNNDKEINIESSGPKTVDPRTSFYVKQALSGIDLKRKEQLSIKTPMGMFAKVMEDKTAQVVRVEQEKIQLQRSQFESEQEFQKERNEIERLKVTSQIDIDKRKLDLESQRIAERQAEREHELNVLKMKHEFELKKLELTKK